jgi:hypothetical protein
MYILHTPTKSWLYSDVNHAVAMGNKLIANGSTNRFGITKIEDGVDTEELLILIASTQHYKLPQPENDIMLFTTKSLE